MFDNTEPWWTLLRAVALFNVLAWSAAAWWLWRSRERWPPDAWPNRRWQLLLSAGYVLGCGWRCWLPVYDVQRLVMVDSFWSSVIVGRSVATIAELCFAAQWALLLREVSRVTYSRSGRVMSHAVLPLIAMAELFSWYSVLTTSNIGHVVEESLWGLCAALLVASLLQLWPRVDPTRRPLLALWCLAGVAYVIYMFGVDVPMYWSRWVADEALGRSYLSVEHGLFDASTRWVVSHQWAHWRSEMVWMTAYFSVAVWLSITLVLLGPLGSNQQARARSAQASKPWVGGLLWSRREAAPHER
jgi:hypothetical protein